MRPKSRESEKYVDVVIRATEILNCFETNPRLSLNGIHEKTGINKSRILRIAGTLEATGFLIRDLETSLYQLGPRMMALGSTITKSSMETTSIVRPYLKRLVKETQETATFHLIRGFRRLCLAREDSPQTIRFTTREGEEKPLYSGAASKVLLAFTTKEVKEKILKEKENVNTGNKRYLFDPDKLRIELELVLRQGYSTSFEETAPGACAVAVPVFQARGQLVGCMAVAGPISRADKKTIDLWLMHLRNASGELSIKLGFSGEFPGTEKEPEKRCSTLRL